MSTRHVVKPPAVRNSPLFPHANGQYAKKIRGRLRYFGTEHGEALSRYHREIEDLMAGRSPRLRVAPSEFTAEDLANEYLEARYRQVESGDLTHRQFDEYQSLGQLIVDTLGKTARVAELNPSDFGRLRTLMASRWGLTRLSNQIGRVRTMCKWAHDNRYLDEPVHLGDQFNRPAARSRRIDRQSRGKKLFEVAEIRRLLDAAPEPMRTMIILGINCGFGNKDCSDLRVEHVDLAEGVIEHFRMKTGIERAAALWPETIAGLRLVIGPRREGPVFATETGKSLVRDNVRDEEGSMHVARIDAIGNKFRKLRPAPSRSFYCLRHTFATIAHETRDGMAVDRVMGHAFTGMRAVYVEEIGLKRLRAVADHVRERVLGVGCLGPGY